MTQAGEDELQHLLVVRSKRRGCVVRRGANLAIVCAQTIA